MNPHFSAKKPGKPRILVAPLDWGLGHATRCIPIIRELLAQQAEVWLAGEGAQEQLLKTEFPELPFLNLPGYRIRYAKTPLGLTWKMIQQAPKMKRAIRAEHQWLEKAVTEYGFDAVISDNRYGLYHSNVPSVFITHQLLIKSSMGNWTEKILQHQNYRYINRFTECWVPDKAGEINLAGELSHPVNMPAIPVSYTGPLSRFSITEIEASASPVIPKHLLIILSGPEPQRSLLEEKIIAGISHYPGTAIVVRGLPGEAALIPSTNMIRFYNHLPAAALLKEFAAAEYVIGRSGYSTVMDIMALQKKSILIPTPGQTEQEYLGNYLAGKKRICSVLQEDFSLLPVLAKAAVYNYSFTERSADSPLPGIIKKLLSGPDQPPALG
jgi:uncharacterized protein (TIGR00661 family)